MDFFEAVRTRQSIRKWSSAPVESSKLDQILDATNRAPSAGNYQAFEIYVVRNEAKRDALAGATFGQEFIAGAPVSLVFCMHPARCAYQPPATYAMQDAAIACTFAMLAVTALGLAAVWIGAFDAARVAAVIGAPEGVIPMAILPIGYAGETPEYTTRRPLSELVHEVR